MKKKKNREWNIGTETARSKIAVFSIQSLAAVVLCSMLWVTIVSQSAEVTVQDTTSPSLAVTKPAGYQSFEVGKSITLEGTASDDFGVKIVEAKLGARSYLAATGTLSWIVKVPIPADYPIGGNTITVRAIDNSGNIAFSNKRVNITPSSSYTYTVCSSGCTYSNLQTAINALPSAGGSILVKDGKYTWSNTITLKSGTHIVFSSGAYITFTGSGKPVLSGNGVSNVSIKGGSITAQYSGIKAFAFWKSSGINVNGTKAVLVQGSNANGFYCVDCIDVYVSNMNIKTATRGIDMKTSVRDASSGLTRNIWVQNNIVDDTSIEGMHINWCKDVHIIRNKVSNTQNNGIDIGFNINSEVRSNTIYKTGPEGEGVHTDSTNTAVVKDNYIDSAGSTGITVYRATKVDVIGNTVVNAGKEGINLIDSTQPNSYVTVKNNYVSYAALNGIYESPNQYQVEIAYNTVAHVTSGYQGIKVIWSNNPTTSVYDNTVI